MDKTVVTRFASDYPKLEATQSLLEKAQDREEFIRFGATNNLYKIWQVVMGGVVAKPIDSEIAIPEEELKNKMDIWWGILSPHIFFYPGGIGLRSTQTTTRSGNFATTTRGLQNYKEVRSVLEYYGAEIKQKLITLKKDEYVKAIDEFMPRIVRMNQIIEQECDKESLRYRPRFLYKMPVDWSINESVLFHHSELKNNRELKVSSISIADTRIEFRDAAGKELSKTNPLIAGDYIINSQFVDELLELAQQNLDCINGVSDKLTAILDELNQLFAAKLVANML